MLNDMWELLIRFRRYCIGLIRDLTKAYHSMRTGLLEMHLRRVVWRHADPKAKVYAFMVVTLGDRRTAALLEIVLKRTIQIWTPWLRTGWGRTCLLTTLLQGVRWIRW